MQSLGACEKQHGLNFCTLRMNSKIPSVASQALPGGPACLSNLVWDHSASYLMHSSSVPPNVKLSPASGGPGTG